MITPDVLEDEGSADEPVTPMFVAIFVRNRFAH